MGPSRPARISEWGGTALGNVSTGDAHEGTMEAKQNMSRLVVIMAVAFVATTLSVRADEQVWTVQSWPGDIDLIPCSAWSRTADGTWVLTGGAIKLGSEVMNNIGVKGDAAAHVLDRECGGARKK